MPKSVTHKRRSFTIENRIDSKNGVFRVRVPTVLRGSGTQATQMLGIGPPEVGHLLLKELRWPQREDLALDMT